MPTEPKPLTLAEAVHKAVEACADGDLTPGLEDYERRFEDDDEPISAIDDIEDLLDQRLGPVELDDDPELRMARAVIVYLRYRRDEIGDDPDHLLHLAARAEFAGHPPPDVARWLEERGISVS
jgi:hypothetical protein